MDEIWDIFYYASKRIEIKDSDKQNFIDSQVRELNNTFEPPPGLLPADYSVLFMDHFAKSRNTSRDLLDKNSSQRIRYMEKFQVGNKECLDELNKIENDPNFDSWENPGAVEYFRNISKS